MNIQLKNIGIIQDATIDFSGLTIITGKNNSGKTTVGKTIYSIVDAVSNLSTKNESDKDLYVYNKLDEVKTILNAYDYVYAVEDDNISLLNRYPNIKRLFDHRFFIYDRYFDAVKFAKELIADLSMVNAERIIEFPQYDLYNRLFQGREKHELAEVLTQQAKGAIIFLKDVIDSLDQDKGLVNYTRESINQTLKKEFNGQIQPVRLSNEESSIELKDKDSICIKLKIYKNEVINDGKAVFYHNLPLRRTFFIDDPYVLDGNMPIRTKERLTDQSVLDTSRIYSHHDRMALVLRNTEVSTVIEQTIINEKLKIIKKKIDSIVPGTYEHTSTGDYYVDQGIRLKVANLATGSKMFAIIKILLDRGLIDQYTLLILDEPEAHLHPEWKNEFAELIVLLVKELDINILLTSHSSSFIMAMDAFVRKYEIQPQTHFYQSEKKDNGMIGFRLVDSDLREIYQDFLNYLVEAKVLRDRYLYEQDVDND